MPVHVMLTKLIAATTGLEIMGRGLLSGFCAGNAEAQYLAGVGVARQRQAIVNGLRDSIKNFASDISDVSSRDVIEMVCAHVPFLLVSS